MNVKIKRGGALHVITALVLIVFVCCLVSLTVSRYSLKVTELTIKSGKVENGFTVVQLSDLHGKEFGEGNSKLIEKIDRVSPAAVFMTGDMIKEDGDFTSAELLISELSERYSVYFSLGNHEEYCMIDYKSDCINKAEKAGAFVFEKEYLDTEINGERVRIGGTSGYALGVKFWENTYLKDADDYFFTDSFSEQRFMLEYEDTDAFKILLLHRPEASTLWNRGGWFDVDIVLSGHTHGGIVRLPFIGGLYAPEEGFFPEYDYGLFEIDGVKTYISSGLSGAKGIPRFNNRPEILSLTVVPA